MEALDVGFAAVGKPSLLQQKIQFGRSGLGAKNANGRRKPCAQHIAQLLNSARSTGHKSRGAGRQAADFRDSRQAAIFAHVETDDRARCRIQ